MPLRLAAILFLLPCCWQIQAQSLDSLLEKQVQRIHSLDTIFQKTSLPDSLFAGQSGISQKSLHSLDSIQTAAGASFNRLKYSYDSVSTVAAKATGRLQQRIDSLNNLNFSTASLVSRLDSVNQWKDQKLSAIQSKADSLKEKVNNKIQSLNLPDELREKTSQLTSMMDKLNVSLPDAAFPDLNFGKDMSIDLPGVNTSLPGLDNSLPGLPNTPGVNLPSGDLNGLTDQGKSYQAKIPQNIPTGMEDISAVIEKQAGEVVPLGEIQKQIGEADQLKEMAGQLSDQEALRQKLKEEVQQQAIDHFAGKEQQLQQAMEQMAKLKRKYSSLNSLSEIPKKRPNEMRGKPFIERVVPGIALQLQTKNDHILTDFNLYVGYRFTGRFTSGAGWNQRIGYDTKQYTWSPSEMSIYGPRAFSEFRLGNGFYPRAEVEVMNAFVPPLIHRATPDAGQREWVWGAFVGMKKEYRFIKNVKGTALIMFRLFNPDHKSPYADVLNARFGFEFPAKQK